MCHLRNLLIRIKYIQNLIFCHSFNALFRKKVAFEKFPKFNLYQDCLKLSDIQRLDERREVVLLTRIITGS